MIAMAGPPAPLPARAGDAAPPPLWLPMRWAPPDEPPAATPLDEPELPVTQTTVRSASILISWMTQLPVRPVVTRVVARPPSPLVASSGEPPAISPAGEVPGSALGASAAP